MIKFEYPTADVGEWQLFDGVNWRHTFATYEQAKFYGEKFGAQRVGKVASDGTHSPQVLLVEMDELIYGSE